MRRHSSTPVCICVILHGLQEDKRLRHHDQLRPLHRHENLQSACAHACYNTIMLISSARAGRMCTKEQTVSHVRSSQIGPTCRHLAVCSLEAAAGDAPHIALSERSSQVSDMPALGLAVCPLQAAAGDALLIAP